MGYQVFANTIIVRTRTCYIISSVQLLNSPISLFFNPIYITQGYFNGIWAYYSSNSVEFIIY